VKAALQSVSESKSNLGAIGLTEDSSQLLYWMVCGLEVARCVTEFEASLPYNRESLMSNQPNTMSKQTASKEGFQSTSSA